MSLPSFVSEKELEEQKKQRQEEWEKVRTADQPKEAPEPQQDNRSLYERLKEQRDKKQFELDEAQKLRHMVRGLDSEEVGFLDFVDNMKAAEEKKRRLEEKQLIEELHKTIESDVVAVLPETSPPSTSSTTAAAKKIPTKPKPPSKQAQLIASSIKRKSNDKAENAKEEVPEKRLKSSESEDGVTCKSKNDQSSSLYNSSSDNISICPAAHVISVRPSALIAVGGLPSALGAYGGDSDSSNEDSDSSSSDNGCVLYTNSTQKIAAQVSRQGSVESSKRTSVNSASASSQGTS